MQIYVNAKARCDGDGSKERPFKRINDAAKIAMPGDEVLVLPGVYREYVNPIHSGTGRKQDRISVRGAAWSNHQWCGGSEELEAFLPGYMGYAHSERSIQ